jgi:hypothetical protein
MLSMNILQSHYPLRQLSLKSSLILTLRAKHSFSFQRYLVLDAYYVVPTFIGNSPFLARSMKTWTSRSYKANRKIEDKVSRPILVPALACR